MIGFLIVAWAGRAPAVVSRVSGHSPVVAIVIACWLSGFVGQGLYSLKPDRFEDRRQKVRQTWRPFSSYSRCDGGATWEMAQEQLMTGWGASSFRFYFPSIRYGIRTS